MRSASISASLLALSLTGCFGPPTSVELTFQTDQRLNPNDAKESTAVWVRVYQLTEAQKFRDANYEKLWANEEGILGDTQCGPFKEVLLNAGADKKVELEISVHTRFLGLMGLFNEFKGKSWQQVVSVDEAESEPFLLKNFEIIRKTAGQE